MCLLRSVAGGCLVAVARLGVLVDPLEVSGNPGVHTGEVQLSTPVLVIRAPAPAHCTRDSR